MNGTVGFPGQGGRHSLVARRAQSDKAARKS